jgi:periplasmic divalent cation tolerance protein
LDYIYVYVTTRDTNEAKNIAQEVIGSRLAACANILDKMTSMYWWKGKIQNETETVLIFKSRRSLFPELKEKIIQLHSYTCPCVIALPIIDGHDNYLDWIKEETSGDKIT